LYLKQISRGKLTLYGTVSKSIASVALVCKEADEIRIKTF